MYDLKILVSHSCAKKTSTTRAVRLIIFLLFIAQYRKSFVYEKTQWLKKLHITRLEAERSKGPQWTHLLNYFLRADVKTDAICYLVKTFAKKKSDVVLAFCVL